MPDVLRTAAVALTTIVLCGLAGGTGAGFEPFVWGLELPVDDLGAAQRLYVDVLGFEVERAAPSRAWAVLRKGEARVVLRRRHDDAAFDGLGRLRLNFRVGDIPGLGERVVEAGGTLADELENTAIGPAQRIRDAAGNTLHLMDIAEDGFPDQAPPEIFNFSVRVDDLAASEAFWTALGFAVFTRDYLPDTLVLERHGTIPAVLHPVEGVEGTRAEAVLLAVDDLEAARAELSGAGIEPHVEPSYLDARGNVLVIEGPSGIVFRIVERPGN